MRYILNGQIDKNSHISHCNLWEFYNMMVVMVGNPSENYPSLSL